jgi:hypothetical protein
MRVSGRLSAARSVISLCGYEIHLGERRELAGEDFMRIRIISTARSKRWQVMAATYNFSMTSSEQLAEHGRQKNRNAAEGR